MSDFHDSHPFSHKWTGIRGSSGGLTLFKAFSELYHNDRDSQKGNDSGYSYTKSYFDTETKTSYLLHWSASNGITQIEHLFSLGNTIHKKGADNIGDKNHGHAASVAFFNPTSMYSESKALSNGNYQSLSFKVKEFDDRVEKMNTGEETDYRAISVKEYMTIRRDKDEMQHEIITRIKNSIDDNEMKSDLESILDSNKPSYMLHLMIFDQNHLYSKSLIDDEYIELFKTISLYYGDILKENYTIKFEASSQPIKGPITRIADSNTAISPTIEQDIHHPIHVTCSMNEYTNKKTKEIDTFIKGEMRVEGHNCTFYVENATSEKRKVYPIRFESKKEWEHAIEKGSFTLSLNCPSKQLFTAYSNRLGCDIKGIDEARGVLMKLFGCILGKPSWDKESMGSQRNAGYFNIIVDMCSKNTANTYFGLKSNKHNSDLLDSHPIIRNFIGKIVKGIIDNYSSYKVSTSTSGVKLWDSDKVFNQLLGKPISKKKPTIPTEDVLNLMGAIEETASERSEEGSDIETQSEVTLEPQPEVQALVENQPEVTVESVPEVVLEPVPEVVLEPVPEVAVENQLEIVQLEIVQPEIVQPVVENQPCLVQQQSVVDTLPNHKIGNVKVTTGLVFNPSIDGTLSMIDNSNVVCRILSVGHGSTLKSYFESVNHVKGPDFVKGLVKVMSDYMETN